MRRFSLLIIFTATLWCVSCSRSPHQPTIDRLPAKVLWEENWSFVTPDKVTWRGNLDDCYISPVVNGFCFAAHSDSTVTLFDVHSSPESLGWRLNPLRDAGFMASGAVPIVTCEGGIEVYDVFKYQRIPLREINGRKVVACSRIYRSGLLSVCNDLGQWGAVDRAGNVVVAPRYSDELIFNEGIAVATVKNVSAGEESYRQFILDSEGNILYSFPPDRYTNGLHTANRIVFADGERWGVMNIDGTEARLLPTVVNGIDAFDGTHLIYKNENSHRGLMTADGKPLIIPTYNSLEFTSKGQLLASNAQHYFLINYRGDEVCRFDGADEVVYLGRSSDSVFKSRFGFAVRCGALWALYDEAGCRCAMPEFVTISFDILFGLEPMRAEGVPAWWNSTDFFGGLPEEFSPEVVETVPDSVVFAETSGIVAVDTVMK